MQLHCTEAGSQRPVLVQRPVASQEPRWELGMLTGISGLVIWTTTKLLPVYVERN